MTMVMIVDNYWECWYGITLTSIIIQGESYELSNKNKENTNVLSTILESFKNKVSYSDSQESKCANITVYT